MSKKQHPIIIGIAGGSGSGKTTFLRCLNFLEKADAGEMDFAGMHINLSHPSTKEITAVRKKTAFVFQGYNLFANKTVLENVTLGLTTGRGMKKAEAEAAATHCSGSAWQSAWITIPPSFPAGSSSA